MTSSTVKHGSQKKPCLRSPCTTMIDQIDLSWVINGNTLFCGYYELQIELNNCKKYVKNFYDINFYVELTIHHEHYRYSRTCFQRVKSSCVPCEQS